MHAKRLTPILHVSNMAASCVWLWPPSDMPWNVREMHVRHPDGHVFRISLGSPES